MEELGVGPGHHLIVGSGNDPDRCLDAWQQLGEFWKVFAVALGVRDGFGEAIAFVARYVVFADLSKPAAASFKICGSRPVSASRGVCSASGTAMAGRNVPMAGMDLADSPQ